MVHISSCPDAQQWQRLLLGRLPDQEAEALEQHLAECGACLEKIRAVQDQDTMVDALRSQSTSVEKAEKETVQRLMERLKGLHGKGVSPAPEDTMAEPVQHAAGDATSASVLSSSVDNAQESYDFLAPAQAPDELGRLGPYRVLKVLGAGGMGVVFQAEDPQLRRSVALKAMLPALAASATARQRFLREAQATAAIDHDHIVHIYQVGEDRGIPFLAMQFLKGETLDDRLQREGKLPPGEALRVGREVAEGLAAAHAVGLIHRDIKPSNIWLEGGRGRVKILDFGLARAAESDARLTQSGAIAGTPAYMSPEQARGAEIDARCDLFSLGCVLYRASTGEAPFKGTHTMSVLLSLAQDHPPSPRDLNPEASPELSNFVMKLLSKDPAGRPGSARAVVAAIEDVERTERDRTQVLNRSTALPGTGMQEKKAATAPQPLSRRRLLVAVAVGLLFVIGAGLAAQIVIRIRDQEGRETKIEVPPGSTVTVEQDGKVVAKAPDGEKKGADQTATLDAWRREDIPSYELAAAGGGDPAKAPPQLVAVLGDSRLRHWGQILSLAYGEDGKVLASHSVDGSVKLWDPGTGKEILTMDGTAMALSRDGKTLAVGGPEGAVRLWDVNAGRERRTLATVQGKIEALAFSRDGTFLASGDAGTVKLWDVATGKEDPHTFQGRLKALSPDGRMLVLNTADDTTQLWDVATGKERQRLSDEKEAAWGASFSPNGETLFTNREKTVKLWDAATGKERLSFVAAGYGVVSLAFSPDGKVLAIADTNAARLYDLTSGKEVRNFSTAWYAALTWGPDDKTLVTGDREGRVQFWDVTTGRERKVIENAAQGFRCLAFSSNGKTLAVAEGESGRSASIQVWDLAEGKKKLTLIGHDDQIMSLAFSPDGKTLASGSGDRTVRLWDVADGKLVTTLRHYYVVNSLAFSPDGKALAAVAGWKAKLWDLGSKDNLMPDADAASCAFSPDGKTLALGGNGNVRLWDMTSRKDQGVIKTSSDQHVMTVTFSPDGKLIASGNEYEPATHLLNVASGKEEYKVHAGGREGCLPAVAFSPDGKTLVTAEAEGMLRFRNPDNGEEREALKIGPAGGIIYQVSYAPDGRSLATVNGNGTVYILRLAPPPERPDMHAAPSPRQEKAVSERTPLDALRREDIPAYELAAAGAGDPKEAPANLVAVLGDSRLTHWGGDVKSLVFGADDKVLFSHGEDGTVRRWDLPAGTQRRVWDASAMALTRDGKTLALGWTGGAVKLWDVAADKELRELPAAQGTVETLAFTADGKTLASGGGGTVKLWDVETGKQSQKLEGDLRAFSPDGKLLAYSVSDSEEALKLWDTSSWKELHTLAVPRDGRAAFSPDSKSLATWGGKGTDPKTVITLWDVAGGKEVRKFTSNGNPALGVAFSPDGKSLVALLWGVVKVFEVSSGKESHAWEFGGSALAFDPEGRTLALNQAWIGRISLWNASTWQQRAIPPERQGFVHALALSPDGKRLALEDDSNSPLKIWDVAASQVRYTFDANREGRGQVAFSPDGKILASDGPGGTTIVLRDPASGKELRILRARNAVKGPLAFSPDAKTLATALTGPGEEGMGWEQTWDVASGRELHARKMHDELIDLAFGLDGRTVISSGKYEYKVKLWDAATGEEQKQSGRHGIGEVKFSPDGSLLALRDEGVIYLWEATTWREKARVTAPTGTAFRSFVFRDDGKTLITAGVGGSISFWESDTGRERDSFRIGPAGGTVHQLALSNDGRHLVTRNGNGTVYVFRLAPPPKQAPK